MRTDLHILFGPGSKPIRLMKSQGDWQVFLRWDRMRSPWFTTWEEARDCAFAYEQWLKQRNAS